MRPASTSRRPQSPSRAALTAASAVAAAAFVAAVAIAGFGSPVVADATVAAAAPELAVAPSTGERVVVDTLYVVSPDQATLAAPASRGDDEGDGNDGEHEGREHGGGDD